MTSRGIFFLTENLHLAKMEQSKDFEKYCFCLLHLYSAWSELLFLTLSGEVTGFLKSALSMSWLCVHVKVRGLSCCKMSPDVYINNLDKIWKYHNWFDKFWQESTSYKYFTSRFLSQTRCGDTRWDHFSSWLAQFGKLDPEMKFRWK